jgi:hypothetical protein
MADIDELRPTPSYPVRPVRENEGKKRDGRQPERKPAQPPARPKQDDDQSQIDEYA